MLPGFLDQLDDRDNLEIAKSLRDLHVLIREMAASADKRTLAAALTAHAAAIERLARMSPLVVAERGEWDAAIWIATVGDPDQVIARLLLLAWHFADHAETDALDRVIAILNSSQRLVNCPHPVAVTTNAIDTLVKLRPSLSPWFGDSSATHERVFAAWGGKAVLDAAIESAVRSRRLDDPAIGITESRFGQDIPDAWLDLVEALAARGEIDLAKDAVRELIASVERLHSSRWIRAQYWPNVAKAYALIGDPITAAAIAEAEDTVPHRQRAREDVAIALVVRGDANYALRFARSIGAPDARYGVLVRIAEAQTAQGFRESARAVLAEAMATAIDPVWISTPIIGRFLAVGAMKMPERTKRRRIARIPTMTSAPTDVALRQAESIRDAACRVEAYANIAAKQSVEGDVKGAWATRDLACETAGSAGFAVLPKLRRTIARMQAIIAQQAIRQNHPEAAVFSIATSCDGEAAAMLIEELGLSE